jgi:acetyl-CoA synthetase
VDFSGQPTHSPPSFATAPSHTRANTRFTLHTHTHCTHASDPHALKGEGIYAYVTLKSGVEYTPAVRKALVDAVRAAIGPIATPDIIHVTPELPKTRSGKIMRRMCVCRLPAPSHVRALGRWKHPTPLTHTHTLRTCAPDRLRKISAGEKDVEQMGDASTLADPGVLTRLIQSKPAA